MIISLSRTVLTAASWLSLLSAGHAQEIDAGADFSGRREIEMRLESARTELSELSEGASVLRERYQQLEAACQFHLAAVDYLSEATKNEAKARSEVSAWNGFPQPPPYSVLLVDDLRETLANLAASRLATETQVRIFKVEVEELGDQLSDHRQAERRFMEAAEEATDPAALQSNRHSVKLKGLSARTIMEEIARREVRIATLRSVLNTIAVKEELADRKLAAIGGRTHFTRAELHGLLAEIARERDEVSAILVAEGRQQQFLNPLSAWGIEFLDLRKAFWEIRFAAINSQNPVEVRSAVATLKKLQGRVDDWIHVSELGLAGKNSETLQVDPARLSEAVFQVRSMQRLIGFAIADLEGWTLRNRGTPVLDWVGGAVRALWDAELYLVEENEIVDGKKIAIYRAVTIGKLLRLALILTVGWFALHFISRRINAAVARRGTIAPPTAALAGKWAFAVGILALIVYGLHAVRIPLTVFAFLGGALAIGVGFGTQTLLKNFISGIIILFERPLKVGDVVEVAGITGTIQEIGIRASVIRHFDGIETLVPNSMLLENQLTNWNFSSTVIRHSILVGVAYGSPTREVSRLLLAVASEHGLVKDDPAPEVRFENFADDALTFNLLFWLDTRKTTRSTLASDLRHMIDKTFTNAGIVIAFPQRDLHLGSSVPLQIQMVAGTTDKPL